MVLPKDPIKAEDYKRRISESLRGENHPYFGKHLSEQHRQNISASLVGKSRLYARRPLSEEHKKKIGDAQRGKIISESTKQKLRLANIGKSPSQETRNRISIANKGKVVSEETRKKLSAASKGRHHTESTKLKIGLLLRERFANPEYMAKHVSGQKKRSSPTKETRKKMSDSRRREKNPKWSGGFTPLYKLIRSCVKMQDWKKAIFKRDGYKDYFSGCAGDLEAHHIISFTKLLKDYNIKTVKEAEACASLWSLDIGVTMLKSNHAAYHNMWGKKDAVE